MANATLDQLTTKPIFMDSIVHINLIMDVVMSYCTPATLIRLSRTCSACHGIVKRFWRLAYNINRHLSRYFDDPTAFRSLQAATATLLSGSTALQYFNREVYPTSDLDLYVYFRFRREVGKWLLSAGYEFAPTTKQHADFEMAIVEDMSMEAGGMYTIPGVAAVFTFTKPSREDPEQLLKVQIIIALNTPVDVILGFHSTCVMQIISWDRAYSLFPWLTFEEGCSIMSSSSSGRNKYRAAGLKKYRERGWQIQSYYEASSADKGTEHLSFQTGWRWIDDKESWIISLDTTDIVPPPAATAKSRPMTRDPVAVCNWRIGLCLKDGGAEMRFRTMRGPMLKYSYLISDEDLLDYLPKQLTILHNDTAGVMYDEELPKMCKDGLKMISERKQSALALY